MQRQSVRPAVGPMLVLLMLTAVLGGAMAFAAGTPTFTIKKAQPTEAGYYIGADVDIAFELQMKYLAQNYTLDIELWNSTDKLTTLDDDKVLPGAGNGGNYTYETTYQNVADLTDEVGTHSYTIKVIDTSSGLLVASKSFSVLVAEESISLSVSWSDASQDRQIDVAESVTFTVYTTWTFVNESKSCSLYVTSGGQETLVDSVSITAGSGSATDTWSTSWASAGTQTVTFTLKDADGETLKTVQATVQVGQTEESASSGASWTDLIMDNIYVVLVIVAVIAIVVVYYMRK